MNVSGTVDFSLFINSGTGAPCPGDKGFDVDGNSFYMGTYNNGYVVDFEPGASVLTTAHRQQRWGGGPRYDWCAVAPFQPFDMSPPLAHLHLGHGNLQCVRFRRREQLHQEHQCLAHSLRAGNSRYNSARVSIGNDAISVIAVNACGSNDPVEVYPVSFYPEWSPLEDAEECYNYNGVIDPQTLTRLHSLWQPGGETTPTLSVSIRRPPPSFLQ
ncbi:MAG: hypothetical protein IPO90_09970 [Flavobacteriales bacterium]|nr:hypothetical protein [Flavobacteriales bacterium]